MSFMKINLSPGFEKRKIQVAKTPISPLLHVKNIWLSFVRNQIRLKETIEMEQNELLHGVQEVISLPENSQLFKALGDATRLRMMGLLKHGELCVCDLMEVLDLPQSTASRHLSYLKNSQWITGRRSGKWMYYKLHSDLCNSHFHNSVIEHIATLPDLQKDYKKLVTYLEKKSNSTQCS